MIVYSRARRANIDEKKIKRKKIIIFAILIISIISIYIIINNYSKINKVTNEDTNENQVEINNSEKMSEIVEQENEIVDVSNIPDKMGNYEVLGEIVLEKIGVTKNILAILENESLKLSVAKLYGPELNEPGNFCICGHNWNNMLKDLSEMEVGDTFYIISRKTQTKVNYKIYKMYTCMPEDLSCLDQNYDGNKEVTIITCNPGGATRLICKARQI